VTGLPGQQSKPAATGADSGSADEQVDAQSTVTDDSAQSGGPQVFGGGPILGVASTSKANTIREFNKKNHYNDWMFVYDPNSDRGGLLKGPIEPDSTQNSVGGTMPAGMQPAVPGKSVMTPQPGGQQPNQPQPPEEQ
jgi:hypothetical protein